MLPKSYEGNISTFNIFSDLLCSVAALGLCAIVPDRGFYSEENVGDLKKLGMQVIAGMKQTPVIQKKFLDSIDRDTIYSAKNQIALRDSIVYAQSFAYLWAANSLCCTIPNSKHLSAIKSCWKVPRKKK